MKKFIPIIFTFFTLIVFGQAPTIEWQRTIGGNNIDVTKSVLQYNNKYIITGFSDSPISGDKTVTNGVNNINDIWTIALNNSGAIVWQYAYGHSFLSGIQLNDITSLHFFDSKFYFGVTYHEWDVFQSRIQIFDENGVNNSIFNPGEDTNCGPFSLTSYEDVVFTNYFKTTNNNYFYSGTKGILTFGCPNTLPTGSYFISLSSSTNYNTVIWSTEYAGSNYDELTSTIQTNDGGFLLSGFSNSNISGDKTENCLGGNDFWIIKTNAAGNIIWQNTIGGNATDEPISVIQTNDNGYLIAGNSNSNASSDKTENSKGGFDYWLVKLDSFGTVQWNKTIGGDLDDKLSKIITTSDGNYLLFGSSKSSISGDKNENSRGDFDAWLIKINPSGDILWQKTFGGNLNDNAYDIIQTNDTGFLILCSSASTISGEKSENNRGNLDYWILKLSTDNLTLNENENLTNIKINPNPTDSNITIDFGNIQDKITLSVYNVLGQLISKNTYNQIVEKQISIEGQNGIYFLEIEDGKYRKRQFKIVKK